MDRLRQQLAREEGLSLIELLVVLMIIGVLLAIAVPSYLFFADRANQSAAQADVRSALPAAEAYFQDYGDYAFDKNEDGSPAPTQIAALQSYDQGITLSLAKNAAPFASYCLQMTIKNKSASSTRGAVPVANGDVLKVACA